MSCPCRECSYDGPPDTLCDYCGEVSDTDICPACQSQIDCAQTPDEATLAALPVVTTQTDLF